MNLSLSKDEHETVRTAPSSTQQQKNQQRTRSIDHRGLDEHRDDSPAQSTNSSYPRAGTNVPTVQDKSGDDHEGEEDIE